MNVLLSYERRDDIFLSRKKYERISIVLKEIFSPSPAGERKISAKLAMYYFLPINIFSQYKYST